MNFADLRRHFFFHSSLDMRLPDLLFASLCKDLLLPSGAGPLAVSGVTRGRHGNALQ